MGPSQGRPCGDLIHIGCGPVPGPTPQFWKGYSCRCAPHPTHAHLCTNPVHTQACSHPKTLDCRHPTLVWTHSAQTHSTDTQQNTPTCQTLCPSAVYLGPASVPPQSVHSPSEEQLPTPHAPEGRHWAPPGFTSSELAAMALQRRHRCPISLKRSKLLS